MKELPAHYCNKKNAKGCWRRFHYSSPSTGVSTTIGHLEAAREFGFTGRQGTKNQHEKLSKGGESEKSLLKIHENLIYLKEKYDVSSQPLQQSY